MKFISLPSGFVIDLDKLASIYPARENPPGLRFSFGAQFNEMGIDDSLAVLAALEANGLDTKDLRKKAGLPGKG